MNDAAILRHALIARPDSDLLETGDCLLSHRGSYRERYTVELRDHAILPALVNAHDHLHLNGIPPLPTGETFANSYAWSSAFSGHLEQPPVMDALSVPQALRHWQGALKNALCGSTLVMHHDPVPAVFDAVGFPVRTLRSCGWAHSLHWQYGPNVLDSFRHTPSDAGWFIHLAEGWDQQAAAELDELHALGCLRTNTVLIHGVGLSDADIARVIASGAALVWCPSSNLTILGRTVAPERLRALFALGRLTLGTDSRLSGARDLLEEMRVAAAHSNFSARELLLLSSVQARRVLRTAPEHDDRIIIRRNGPDPFRDLLQLQRHELRAVIRNGEPLIADPDFEAWFVRRQIPFTQVWLDGCPKLCASAMLAPLSSPQIELEPGLLL